ncbi:hypothetical protein GUA87_09615 [Sneathiella sp. P13V-1]|uniref:hypothetical protein n=1 Tax=Sneathiella sp. P13V-1 TaxID=2697366 RepID=UPI00187B412A|nr:hypothetical protein [Sneathiella sp. P13V-1]MBE7637099.1 hypothetical protein [Sneathiella sp. P13V-1]
MYLLLILPTLVAGFIACHIHPENKDKLHRYQGQYLYLKSAEMGLKCFALALLVGLLAHVLIPDDFKLYDIEFSLKFAAFLGGQLTEMGVQEGALLLAWVIILSVLTCFAPFLLKFFAWARLIQKHGADNLKLQMMGEALEDSPLDSLLYSLLLKEGSAVMLSLSDRKVYVGEVISMGEPSETGGMDQDISITPIMSGYRDDKTLEVNFVTDYDDADGEFYLTIRQEMIVSATEFDFIAYSEWNKPEAVPADTTETVEGK